MSRFGSLHEVIFPPRMKDVKNLNQVMASHSLGEWRDMFWKISTGNNGRNYKDPIHEDIISFSGCQYWIQFFLELYSGDSRYLMDPCNADPNLTTAPLTPTLITPRNIKRSIIPLLMGIFVRKLVKRKGYMLRMQYTKLRKKRTFQKHGIPFLKRPL